MFTCLICNKPVPDYEPEMCCSGYESGCMGQPINPSCCSIECEKALFGGIGKEYEQRRIDAGIKMYVGKCEHGLDFTKECSNCPF